MSQLLTAAKLYDFIQCPHRVWRDIYGPQQERIKETNPFVKLLWERGVAHEEEVVARLGEFRDLGIGSLERRFELTLKALRENTELIYQGVLRHENMLGIPDLLKRLPGGQYVPVEIKSGMGFEGIGDENGEDSRPKKHYAVQLALYVDLLHRLGFQNDYLGRIIDIHGIESNYDLNSAVGKKDSRSLWDFYRQVKNDVRRLIDNQVRNTPALVGVCKLCHWYNSCKKWIEVADDLTRIYYLGRSKRDVINADLGIYTAADLLDIDIKAVLQRKRADRNFLKGVGEKTLDAILRRAQVLVNIQKPVLHSRINFPEVRYNLYFDIEDDPTRDFVYLHGLYLEGPDGSRYQSFFAPDLSPESEKSAWLAFWDFIRALPHDDFAVYYYSQHEKNTYRRLQKRYPEVVGQEELEGFFGHRHVIDLYDVVRKHTDWPLSSYSLKDLAQYLGFRWRDSTPSGALSIEWYNRYIQSRDPQISRRLLDYNEDDCRATMALKKAIEAL